MSKRSPFGARIAWRVNRLVLVLAAAGVAACGGDRGAPLGASAPLTASYRFNLPVELQNTSGNDFTGNYVAIAGARAAEADGKYPCLSGFEVCLPLTGAGATDAIADLCPSADYPEADWRFTFAFYADDACTVALGNLACPERTETLGTGLNERYVQCYTRNADAGFHFCIIDPVSGAGVGCAAEEGELDQSTGELAADTHGADQIPWAQTFTAGLTGDLDRVEIYVHGPNELAVTVSIRTVDGTGQPTDAILASAVIPAAGIPEGDQLVSVTFDPPAPVAAGTRYAIYRTPLVATGWSWNAPVQNDVYAGGQAWADRRGDLGFWESYAAYDLPFRTYVR